MNRILKTILLILIGHTLYAQIDLNKDLPTDPQVRIGTLDNGLRYYIRANNHPEGHASFHLFHKVGAIDEEDNQNGLAHFLEHMAFKGLTHFPDKSLLDYLEKIGVKFGGNLNASTSTEYTSYMITQVPLTRQGIIDTCLLALHDWSGGIVASQEAIDSERGVIREEWRMRGGLRLRISDAMSPYFYQNSKYAERNVIGDMDIISNFERKELMDFYHKWYRPDLQAVAIVGDFDPLQMEKSVQQLFSKIPKPIDPNPKVEFPLPDNEELIYGVYSDKEAPNTKVDLLIKHTKTAWEDAKKGKEYAKGYTKSLITSMMNARWSEISYKKDLPVRGLNYGRGSFAADKNVFGISAEIKPGQEHILPGLDIMLQETERFRRYGFTDKELELAKAKFRRTVERNYIERDKKNSSTFIRAYQNNFLQNSPILSDETTYELLNQILDNISLAEVNEMVKELYDDRNTILTIVTSEDDAAAVPEKDYIVNKLKEIRRVPLEPFVSRETKELTPAVDPVDGKVIHEKEIEFGAVEWTLSNGIKVYLMPTEHKKDEIIMNGYSPGGYSLLNDEEYFSGRLLTTALGVSGVGELSAPELSDALAGKTVYVTPFVSDLSESMTGATTPKDFEEMVKLMYMYFTEPRFDEEAFSLQMKNTKASLTERKLNPFTALQDSVAYIRSNYHPRALNLIIEPEDVDKVDFEVIKNVYHKIYGHPTNFTFVFTGAIDKDALKPIIEKYIGALQGRDTGRDWVDVGRRSPQGIVNLDFTRRMENPKAITFIEYTGNAVFSQRKETTMQLLQGILEMRFNKLLREEKSATYSTALEGRVIEEPTPRLQLIVSFETEPTLMDELVEVVYQELDRLVAEGVDEEDLAKAREFLIKNRKQMVINNHYWQFVVTDYAKYNGRDKHSNIDQYLIEINAKEVTALLKELLDAHNRLNVTMRPAE